MIVPTPPNHQTMVSSEAGELFSRSQYQIGGGGSYDAADTCYSTTSDTPADQTPSSTGLQYRDWEMRVYNQMHANGSSNGSTDTDYFLAARKAQENYAYSTADIASYPTYQPNDYVVGYPSAAQNPAAYYSEVGENIYYTPEQLAAQQYYQQQHAAVNGELYYASSRQHNDGEEFVGGYDGSNDNLSYQSAGSSGRPSPHQHYDRSSMPSSPECHKYAAMYIQSANGHLMHRGDNSALLCAVCGDNAACQHYGVRTCEGCKGFFKRTVQKKAKYVCLANKKCPVDKRRRNRCQFCRFQKCLAVGMVKEVVRSDSLKGRRGRLPSKPKSPTDKPVSPPLQLVTTLVQAHMEQALDATNLKFVGEYGTEKDLTFSFLEHLVQNVQTIKTFFTRGNGAFAELLLDDKDKMAQLRCFHFFLLRLAERLKVTVDTITLPNGTTYHRTQLQGVLGELIARIAEFAVELQRSEIDIQAFSCLLILSVLKEKNGVRAPSKIESAESKVYDSLRDHCTYNPDAQNQPHLYSKTISLLNHLNNLCQHLISRLHQAVVETSVTVPSEINLLFPKPPSPPSNSNV